MKVKIKISIAVCAFTLIWFCAFSQEIESKSKVKKDYDSLVYLYKNVYLKQSYERYEISKQLSGSFGGANSLSDRIQYLLEGISILEELDSTDLIIESYNNLGRLFWLNAAPDKSIAAVNKVLELALASNNLYWVGNAYGNLSQTLLLQKQYEKALVYELKALDVFISQKDTLLIFNSHGNLGEIYYHLDRFDEALESIKKAMTYRRIDESYFVYVDAYVQSTLAFLLARQGKYDSAKILINYTDEILSSYSFDLDQRLAYSNVELADIFMQAGDNESAIEYAKIGFKIGRENNLNEIIRDGALVLATAYEHKKEESKALNFYKTYYAYRDSIVNVENVKQVESLRADFEISQKQTELDIVEVRRKNQELISYIIGGVLFVILVLALIVYRSYRQKLALSEKLALINESKNKLFSIISHDLRGPMAAFSGVGFMIKSAMKSGDKSFLEQVATEVDKSSKQLSSLLENLLSWAMQEQDGLSVHQERINVKEVFDELKDTFESQSKVKNIQIETELVQACDVSADRNMTYTIFRNLISNAIKFTPEDGRIVIQCTTEHDVAKIEVKDSGVGMSKEKVNSIFQFDSKKSTYGTSGEKGLGLGLQLVSEFVEINNGTIYLESEEGKGTTFIVKLPLHIQE